MKRYIVAFYLSVAIVAGSFSMGSFVNTTKAQRGEAVYQTSYSLNWAGYVAYTSATDPLPVITKVSATWTQPTIVPSKTPKYASFWIGIGGFFSGDQTLIQTGTGADTNKNQVSYYAWYELLPAAMISIPCLTIRPGDGISAYIQETSTNQWIIDLQTDRIGGGSCTYTDNPNEFRRTFTYASSKKSADWVVERPSLCFITCQLTKLANFGTVTFNNAAYVAGGSPYSISGAGTGTYDVVLMVSGSGRKLKLLCDISPGSNPGSTFTGIWKASG